MTAPLARRSFITGLISLVAAPAIVRAGSLMPVKADLVIGMDFGSEPALVYGYGPMMHALPPVRWRSFNEIICVNNTFKKLFDEALAGTGPAA